MCKKPYNILMLSLLGFASCTQAVDEPSQQPQQETPDGMQTVKMSLSRAAADDFGTAGIDKYTIYIYKTERKTSSLYAEKEVGVTEPSVSLSLPLGEQFRVFAVANTSAVSEKETFETVTLHLEPFADKAVWMSAVTSFASDKSVSTLDLTMQRVVSRVDFVPAETEAELAAQTEFDKLTLSFTNTSRTYKVSGKTAEAYTLVAETDASKGYKTSFYTFETSSLGAESMLDINYIKGGQQVNTSAGSLETGVTYAANNRYTMSVPVLSTDFVQTPWTTMSRSGRLPAITVTKTAL